MNDHKKLYRLLQLIALLRQSSGYPVERLARRFDTTTRTIYRYFELLRECGFEINKTTDNRYYMVTYNNESAEPFAGFSFEEAAALREALLAVHSDHPLKESLLGKLNTLTDIDDLVEVIYDRMLARNISLLNTGIQEQRQVYLYKYHSLNTGHINDRMVEPVGFTANMKYLVAYDITKQAIRQFKPERIGEVEVLDTPFANARDHQNIMPDRFGMNGDTTYKAVIWLSDLALQLLQEEYPATQETVLKAQTGWHQLEIPVKGFEGIGRFLLGLPGEVKVASPPELQHYLEEKMRMQWQGIYEKN